MAVDKVVGVVKAYTTRVGKGPFPTEDSTFLDPYKAGEVGTTTGRSRRVGYFDAVLVKQAVAFNSVNCLALTKLDILDDKDEIKVCTHYNYQGKTYNYLPSDPLIIDKLEPQYVTLPGWKRSTRTIRTFKDLPQNARAFIWQIELLCDAKIEIVSVGPEDEHTIYTPGFKL